MRRTCAKGAFAVLTAIFVSGVAHAEDLTTKAPESMSSQPPITQAWPAPAHIFGDWNGLRTKLADLGITYSVTYTSESVYNVAGGLRSGADYAHQIGLGIMSTGRRSRELRASPRI
jgi:carbohydrate-selective porin OprB